MKEYKLTTTRELTEEELKILLSGYCPGNGKAICGAITCSFPIEIGVYEVKCHYGHINFFFKESANSKKIITNEVKTRRRWKVWQKVMMLKEIKETSILEVSEKYKIDSSLLYKWRMELNLTRSPVILVLRRQPHSCELK